MPITKADQLKQGLNNRALKGTIDLFSRIVMPVDIAPDAVEVAAYRIVCEALTNISKHSQATECNVRFALNGALQIDVQDNGLGMPEGAHAGVGMFSMRERAAELGGTFTIQPNTDGGVHITAHLPCEVSSNEL